MTQPTTDSPFTFDTRMGSTGRYRRNGRLISATTARRILDRTLDNAADPIKELSTQLREGNLRLEDWRLQMQRQIKSAHIASMAAQKGGFDQLTRSDYGRAGAIIKRQYQYLEGFVNDVQTGKQRLDGTLQRRAQMYIDAGRNTYHRFEQLAAVDRGFNEERSVLNPADHCMGCIEEARKDWQPIGQMVPIGQRDCRSNCKCSVEYRQRADDDTGTGTGA